jgi:hypothetical protein
MILGEHKKYIVNFKLPTNYSSTAIVITMHTALTDNVHAVYYLVCNCLVD